jgi:hypothetical protein
VLIFLLSVFSVSQQIILNDSRFKDFSATGNGVTFKMIAVEAGTFMMRLPGVFEPNSRFHSTQ